MSYRFLLVDDHAIIRTGVSIVLTTLFPNCQVDEAGDGDFALEYIKANNYDVVILDLNMPHTDSATLVPALLSQRPNLKILIFTMAPESVVAKHYLKLGVSGFISKEVSMDELRRAVLQILQNKRYLSEDLVFELTQVQLKNKSLNPFENLSKRELQLLMYLINGDSIGDIAESLNIGRSTVATHKANIFEKLQIDNVIKLREMARLYGMLNSKKTT